MVAFDAPEIRRLDLAAAVLGVRSFAAGRRPEEFGWFEVPQAAAIDRAEQLLDSLGLIDREQNRLTSIGEVAARLPAHPRIARMLIEARRLGCELAAAEIAALLGERELLRSREALDLDALLELLHEFERRGARRGDAESLGLDYGVARAVLRGRDRLSSRGARDGRRDPEAVGCALVAGFPDRVVRNDGGGTGLLVGGRGVSIAGPSLEDAPLLVALRVEAVSYTHLTLPTIYSV